MEKEILSVGDASALLSLPEAEVVRLLSEGELPGRRVGPHWYISRQRLLDFIADVKGPESGPEVSRTDCAKSIPVRALAPNWRCEKCEAILPPEVVECTKCGAARNTPLMGFRLPRATNDYGTSLGKKIN